MYAIECQNLKIETGICFKNLLSCLWSKYQSIIPLFFELKTSNYYNFPIKLCLTHLTCFSYIVSSLGAEDNAYRMQDILYSRGKRDFMI